MRITSDRKRAPTFVAPTLLPPRKMPSLPTLCFSTIRILPLLSICLGQLLTSQASGAEKAADPHDELYNVIMTRYGKDGKPYAENEPGSTIHSDSDFPFGDKTYKKFETALDNFAVLPQKKIQEYSGIKRALLQIHLWKVFDKTEPYRWIDGKSGEPKVAQRSYPDRRAALQPKIAALIKKLALTKAQILALPNTRVATVKSGSFATRHDPSDAFKPFLPADLYAEDSSWVCLGDDDNPIPAPLHTKEARWRSIFITFMRLPEGRATTLQFLEKAKDGSKKFPAGTQFALVEQAFLISDEGKPVLSPLIASIALRAFLDVDRKFRKSGPPTQSLAEFLMQPRQLMKGNAVMKALNSREHRFETGEGFFPPGRKDPFEKGSMPRRTRLNTCMGCHSGRGLDHVQTVINVSYSHFLTGNGPDVISEATSDRKRKDHTWEALLNYWK